MRTYWSRLATALLLMSCLAVAACGTGLAADAPVNSAGVVAGASDVDNYRLGAGDKVRVTTFGEPTLTGEFSVGGAGVVSFPLIGDVSAQGATVSEFRDRITRALSNGYLVDPRVSVEVLTFRPFYVLGEVGKPGEYPYTESLTVLNAVALAGGFTYRANTGKVLIKHQNESQEREYPLTVGTAVLPGDTIRITERYF